MLQFIKKHLEVKRWQSCFNTSHVVVYPCIMLDMVSNTVFQYISCCSLSMKTLLLGFPSSVVSIHLMLQFINIIVIGFNSILLFQYISCCSLSQFADEAAKESRCFNTSHVVVYLPGVGQQRFYHKGFNTSHVVVYLLSLLKKRIRFLCFNTSHVVVYPPAFTISIALSMFQYISCCSLSVYLSFFHALHGKFQYISCCSLSFKTRLCKSNKMFQYISCCSLSLNIQSTV